MKRLTKDELDILKTERLGLLTTTTACIDALEELEETVKTLNNEAINNLFQDMQTHISLYLREAGNAYNKMKLHFPVDENRDGRKLIRMKPEVLFLTSANREIKDLTISFREYAISYANQDTNLNEKSDNLIKHSNAVAIRYNAADKHLTNPVFKPVKAALKIVAAVALGIAAKILSPFTLGTSLLLLLPASTLFFDGLKDFMNSSTSDKKLRQQSVKNSLKNIANTTHRVGQGGLFRPSQNSEQPEIKVKKNQTPQTLRAPNKR